MKHTTYLSLALVAAVAAISGCATPQSTSPGSGWQSLVQGTVGLDNFNRVGPVNWVGTDGAIQANPTGTESGFLMTKASYGDFMIKAELWVDEVANSGIFIRCANPVQINAQNCYEVNVFDKRPDPSYGTGAIVNVAKVDPMPRAAGKWNTLEITAQGPHLVITFNGQKTVDIQDGKHAAGPFALQWGAGVVKFRSVQVKPL